MQTLHEQEPVGTIRLLLNSTQPQEQATLSQTTRKRLVSKRRFVVNIGKKVVFSSVSLGFLLVASCAVCLTYLFVSIWFLPAGHRTDFGTPEEAPPWILGSGITALICYFLAWRSLHKVSNIDPGVPLTRANTADLTCP